MIWQASRCFQPSRLRVFAVQLRDYRLRTERPGSQRSEIRGRRSEDSGGGESTAFNCGRFRTNTQGMPAALLPHGCWAGLINPFRIGRGGGWWGPAFAWRRRGKEGNRRKGGGSSEYTAGGKGGCRVAFTRSALSLIRCSWASQGDQVKPGDSLLPRINNDQLFQVAFKMS